MYPVNMLNDINMEFIQAFNPLYAVPIVAVILCAFIVYAFGFKSPVPPPSFEGIEEEKKYSKKRRVKDNQKVIVQKKEKLLQNGKVNGSTSAKSSAPSLSKKKESTEKHVAEKSNIAEKPVAEKKANKKARLHNEKKSIQEKKKENISQEDFNDDGWVQLVSKKGRKNKKKDDAAVTETQSNASVLTKTIETNKSDDSSQVEESPKKSSELLKDKTTTDRKQPTPAAKKENVTTKATPISNVEKPKIQNVVEDSKSDDNLEKQHPKETAANSPKILEESNKPKKKKKKNTELIHLEKESTSKNKNVLDTSTVQVISDIPAPQEIIKPVTIEDLPPVSKVEKDQPSEVKTSNVVFDELAGLYPETKEQKKKKKVRRDH